MCSFLLLPGPTSMPDTPVRAPGWPVAQEYQFDGLWRQVTTCRELLRPLAGQFRGARNRLSLARLWPQVEPSVACHPKTIGSDGSLQRWMLNDSSRATNSAGPVETLTAPTSQVW